MGLEAYTRMLYCTHDWVPGKCERIIGTAYYRQEWTCAKCGEFKAEVK